MDFDTLFKKWAELSFNEFSILAQQLGGVSSDKVNSVICGVENEKKAEQVLRFVIAMHYQLGRRAEFMLSDRSIAVLVKLVNSSTSTQMPIIPELAVLLLCLNAAGYTFGVEQQLCAEFLSAAQAPQRQLVFLPLVFRPFYSSLRKSSLSSGAFNSQIRTHALTATIHHRLRLVSLVYSAPEDMNEFIVTQLLNADIHGTKAFIGSAPVAMGLDGKAAKLYTVLHRNDNMSPSQVQHCYLLSSLTHFIRRNKGGISVDGCIVVMEYLREVFAQITAACNNEKCCVFSTNKAIGLHFMEAVACEAINVARLLCKAFPDLGDSIVGDVSGFMYLALQVSRAPNSRLPAEEAPELHSYELTLHTSTMALPTHTPHFSSEVILTCLEFHIETNQDLSEVLDVFNDIFESRLWSHFLSTSATFPTQLCLLLLRRIGRLRPLLPRIAPRIMWLLSQYPQILFPLVKRLLPHMMAPSTSIDLFCRIIMLPLLCFANDHRPVFDTDTTVEGEMFVWELWNSLNDWTVDEAEGVTPFADLCLYHMHSFEMWDNLHLQVGSMNSKMVCAFRVVKPLLAAYFNSPNLPECIFELLTFGYFFMVAPQDHKHVVSDFLLEMGRWVVETKPQFAMAAIPECFERMISQDHIPPNHRSSQLQRFGCVAAAMTLGSSRHENTPKLAAHFFDITHELIWELVAMASAEVTDMSRGGRSRSGVGAGPTNFALQRDAMPFSSSSYDDFASVAPSEQQLAADFVYDSGSLALGGGTSGTGGAPQWKTPCSVWRSVPVPSLLRGVAFTQHLHSLVIALTMLTKRSNNLQERGVICLANIVRTLQRTDNAGFSLAATATLCMKYLRYPSMDGVETMPLRALLGVNGF